MKIRYLLTTFLFFASTCPASTLAFDPCRGGGTNIKCGSSTSVGSGGKAAVGVEALKNLTTGANDTAGGYRACDTVSTGSNNSCFGKDSDVSSGAGSNRTAIGANATATVDNSIKLGDASVTLVTTTGTFESTAGGFKFPDTTTQTTAATPPAISGTITSGTTGSVLFVGPGSTFAQDNPNFFWDDTNNLLGIGTAAPDVRLDVSGTIRATGISSPTTGAGVEVLYTGGIGYIQAYDRDGAAWKPLIIDASNLTVQAETAGNVFQAYFSSTELLRVESDGAVVITETGGNGGNVVHRCNIATGGAGTTSVSCAAGEIATGGAVDCGNAALFVSSQSFTGGSPATGYSGSCTSLMSVVTNGTIVVQASCCDY